LIRYKNVLPTTLLSFAGGWLLNPSFTHLFHSTTFVVSTINTILLLAASMAINDFFDFEIDKINHPDRPLVTGEIQKREAVAITFGLFGTSQLLSSLFLPVGLQGLILGSALVTLLYTPLFKRIPFVKNLVCAGLVSLSVFLGGISAATEYAIPTLRFGAFSLTMSIIFGGSLYNELLLDIRDVLGDAEHQIYTIPVLFGKKAAWIIAGMVLYANVFFNALGFAYLYHPWVGFSIPIIFSPIFFHYYQIRQRAFSKESLKEALGQTTPILGGLLLYIMAISGK
jgi:geranylgeranylglycerol-phosphate geranylgeranyltransferase